MQNCRTLGAPSPDPQNSPPLQISGYAPACNSNYQQYERPGAPGPLNSILARQFKRITRKKWRVFVLKVAISDPHTAFLWT